MYRHVDANFTRDGDGAEIVVVPLANDRGTAKLLQDDYDRIVAAGYSTRWALNPSGDKRHPEWAYVRTSHYGATGGLLGVARLIMQAGAGQVIKYADGDRTNLRRDNLVLVEGFAKRRDASFRAEPKPAMQFTPAEGFDVNAALPTGPFNFTFTAGHP